MSRIRWFRISLKTDATKFYQQLRSKPFFLKDPISSGFRVESKDSIGMTGQFIHKRTVDQKIILPSGEEFIQEVAHIDITKFGVDFSSSSGLLYLVDPPRSTTPFFSALAAATKFNCIVEPIEVCVDEWIKLINANKQTRTVITYLDITGINISKSIQARLAISGDKEVDIALRKLIKPENGGTVKNAKIVCDFGDGERTSIELGCHATLKTPEKFSSLGIQTIRTAMLLAAIKIPP